MSKALTDLRRFTMQTHGDNGVVALSLPIPSCEADMDEIEASILIQLRVVRRQLRRLEPEFHPLAAHLFVKREPHSKGSNQ